MLSWTLSLLVPILIAALWHGISLQIATVLAGEQAPRFTRAVWVSWLGGLVGGTTATLWSYTFGLAISLFVSSWLAWAIGIVLAVLSTGAIYKRGLKLSSPAAVGVAGTHLVLSLAVNALLGWLTFSMLF